MLTKPWKANRPRGLEYDIEEINLALVRWWPPDTKLWEHDVLGWKHLWVWYFYITIYDEKIDAFIAYPLGWHSVGKTHINELEIYENVFDFYMKYEEFRKCLPIQWPYKTFLKNLEFYLNNAGFSLYR